MEGSVQGVPTNPWSHQVTSHVAGVTTGSRQDKYLLPFHWLFHRDSGLSVQLGGLLQGDEPARGSHS